AEGADAVEAVEVDYEPLPAVVDIEAATAADAPILFEDHGTNLVFETAMGHEEGDGDPLEGADQVVETRMVSQRLAGVPLEPNGCVAIPNGDALEVWIPSQNPIAVRDAFVGQLGLDPEKLRVAAPTVGGGFGPKSGPYVEHLLTIKLAQDLNRPIKWTEERSENMVSLAHGRAMVLTAKLGLKNDGTIVGLDCNVVADCGAYPALGGVLTTLTQTMIQGVYQIPKIR
ncbi:MAG: molybdopterin-dependent oxidoreductase, partial [Actinomycetia bacterium]|nr:molybdopterin-dependent oxidoreductase [Actinomycetes bacterium]